MVKRPINAAPGGYPTPVSATTARYLQYWYQFVKVVKRPIYVGLQGVPDTSLRYDGALPTVPVSICYQFTGAFRGYPTPVSTTTAHHLQYWYEFVKVVKRPIYGGSQGVPNTSLRYDSALPAVLVSICYQFTGARMGYPTPVSATTARYLHNWY